jgi:hypothetical protein
MELDWSRQSAHIRSLFRPWQPGDGYDEATIQEAEARIGARLPAPLRTLYRAWGHRDDLTMRQNFLRGLEYLEVKADTLVIFAENQATCCWGIPRAALSEADPPVVITDVLEREVASEDDWRPFQSHLSDFLDDMTYLHAFLRGAVHGGWRVLDPPELLAHHKAWLEEHWSKAFVRLLAFGLSVDETGREPGPLLPLYVRDGQAFDTFGAYHVAAREASAVDEIGQRLQLTWEGRW